MTGRSEGTTLTELTLDDARNIDSCARTVFGQSTVNKNYTVDSRNNYTGIGADSPSWTDNSELEDDDERLTFTWNWRGELVSVDDGASTYTFEHDALGRRITTDFGTELRYTFAGERIVEEISAASSPTVLGTWAASAARTGSAWRSWPATPCAGRWRASG